MRIIITGSRDWRYRYPVVGELDRLIRLHGADKLVIVHGDNRDPDCPDNIAHSYAVQHNVDVEPWPVLPEEWAEHGRAAGPKRNERMVRAGAELCLAFIAPCRRRDCMRRGRHGSHGASNCAALAQAAGIDTRIFGQRA